MTTTETTLLHLTDNLNTHHGSINTPVYRSSLFGFETYQAYLEAIAEGSTAPIYTRITNPTRADLEAKVAFLEQADHAIAFSSGMGAISAALLSFLSAGDHLLMVACCYGPTREFCQTVLTRLGITIDFFPPAASSDLSPYLKPNTKLIYLESPGSLTFQLQNIQAITQLAQANNIITVIDNSWATPLYQQPLTLGVDVVVHSGTKYIAGHSDVVVGLLACQTAYYPTIKGLANLLGANLSPDDAYLVSRGLRTLPIRLAQQAQNGLKVARWLQTHPEVEQVLHPGLPNFPDYDLAQQQMQGVSSLFSFKLHPRGNVARHAFVNALQHFTIGVSWGGFESLILPLAHVFKDDPAIRKVIGLEDDTYRVAIGLENPDDLVDDLAQGLAVFEAAALAER